jgi:hypothetical protein
MKRVVKYGSIGIGAIALLWALLAVVLWFAFPPAKVKTIVLEQAATKLHRKVGLESADIRVFPFLGVSLKGFSVANNPDSGFSKEPLASLKSLDVRLSLASLLEFSPVVDAIVLEKPSIRMEVLADGRTSLDGLGGPKDTTTPKSDSVKPLELPFPLTVRRIAIIGGSAAYVDRKAGREITVGDITQEVSLSTDKSLQNVRTKGKLAIKDISVSGSGFPVRKGGIHLEVEHDLSVNLPKATVEIRGVRASLQGLGVTVSGKASNVLVTPDLDLKIATDGSIDLSKLLAEVPKELSPELSKLSLGGHVDFAFSIKGKVGPTSVPDIDGAIHARGISASVQGVPAKLSNLGSRVTVVHTRTVEIDSTQWTLDGVAGSLRLAVDSLPVPPHKSIPVLRTLQAQGRVDLSAVATVLSPLVPILDTLKPTGNLGWNVAGKGPLDPSNPTGLQIQGKATLEKVSAKIPGLPDRPVVDGTADLSNTSAGANVAVVMGPSDLSVGAKVSDWLALVLPKLAQGRTTAVTVAVKSRNIDLDRLLPATDTTKKSASQPLTELPVLPPVTLSATFQADRIQAMGLALTAVSGKATLQKAQLAESFSAGLAQGKINQTLSADLSDRKAPGIRLVADVAGVQIHDALVGMKDHIPQGAARSLYDKIYGKASGHVQAQAKCPIPDLQKKLSADLNGSVADGKIVNFPAVSTLTSKAHALFPSVPDTKELAFKTLSVQAQLVDGKVVVKDLVVDGSALGQVQANGTIGADQSLDLHVDTHLPQAASSLTQSGASSAASALGLSVGSPLPQDKQKRVVVSWNVKGTVAKPSVAPDLPKISSLARSAVSAVATEAKKQVTQKVETETRKVVGEQKQKATEEVKSKAQGILKGIKKPW